MTDEYMMELLKRVTYLGRGCCCEYDYRCSNCSQLIKLKKDVRDFLELNKVHP